MFLVQTESFRHTFNPLTKGKLKGRQQKVNVGYFVIEHVATGKLIIGSGRFVSETIDTITADLMGGKFQCKAFCKLVESDCELSITEAPILVLKDARKHLAKLKDSIDPTFLLMKEIVA